MATSQELVTQFETDLGSDVKSIRTALSNKGVSASTTKLSGVASKINSVHINYTYYYTGTITVNYPTTWTSGYIYASGTGVSPTSVKCNGTGRATFSITQPGSFKITNSRQSADSSTVTFS